MFGDIALNRNLVDSRSCIRKAVESKWADAALMITSVVLLVIGVLATCQIFNSIGTANALYLSYGAYMGVACLFVVEMIKIVTKCRFQPIILEDITTDEDVNRIVKKVEVSDRSEGMPDLYFSEITFKNGLTLTAGLVGYSGYLLLNAIENDKMNISREEINERFQSTPSCDGIYRGEKNGAEVLKSIFENRWL